ncbi:hypothetical protein, partial [Pseudomonas sp.]|uniref:hypothetical protein n=1 Tax=Pseudomonas sp. TaxID=306 RepID=UPI0027228679
MDLNNARRQFNDRRSIGQDTKEKCLQEFDKLLMAPKIKGVAVNSQTINIETEVLFCRNKATGLLYEIGAFCLGITPKTARINWSNLTRRVDALN